MSKEAKELYDYLSAKYKLNTDKDTAVLEMYCGSIVNMREAQKKVDELGVTIDDRYGVPKANPAVDVVRISKSQAMTALKMLDLNEEVEDSVMKDFE